MGERGESVEVRWADRTISILDTGEMAGLQTPVEGLRDSGGHTLKHHVLDYMTEAKDLCSRISHADIESLAVALSKFHRTKGKVWIVGLGGSLANAIHMSADLRKLCNIDSEAFDNIAELTARMNDEGPETIFINWLSRMRENDCLLVLSVGGGTANVSRSLREAINTAKNKGRPVYGIVGPKGGYTSDRADICIKIPVENLKHITPHTEAFQAVVWHCLVSHPLLQMNPTKW